MKRVLVAWGQSSTSNLGVRALAEGAAALVHEVSPEAEVVTHSYGHGPGPINIGVPRSLAREFVLDSRGARSWMSGFDLVLDTRQGDSFADIYGLVRLRAQTAFAEFARRCGVPVVMAPQTIGPFNTRQGRWLGRWSLKHADVVMTRDHVSAEVAGRLGRRPDVTTTDVVFALPVPAAAGERDVVVNVSGLLWSSDDHGPKQAYRATVRKLVEGLRAAGREVSLLAHVIDSPSSDNDLPAVRELGSEYGIEAVVPSDLNQVRAILRGARLVYGSRMHACLNALSVGTPAVPLAYSRKFAPLLADIGWQHVVGLDATDAAEQALALGSAQHELAAAAATARARADELLVGAREALRELL